MIKVYATGMPRSGSRAFYSIVEDIVEENSNLKLCNKSGHGRQHQHWTADMHDGISLSIVRDLRDVVVSAYPYIMNHHKQKDSDPRQAGGKHPLYEEIYDKSKTEAYDVLINELLPDCYDYFKSHEHTNSRIFLFKHFFPNLKNSINNLSDILRTEVNADGIYENHTLDSLKEDNPKHYMDGKVGKWRVELNPEQGHYIRNKYSDFYDRFVSLN